MGRSELNERPDVKSEWPWPRELDALVAAPDSHRLLLETDRVRVLEVVIEPGELRDPRQSTR